MVNANPQRQLSEQQVSERSLSERPVNPTSPPRHGSAALLLGAWLWTGLATAQNPPTQPPTPPQGQDKPAPVDMKEEGDYITFAFNEANGMELAEFIKYAERMTHRVFVLGNEQELATAGQGTKVTFVGTLHFRKERLGEDFFAFFQTMLYIKGFALVPRGEGKQEMLEIVAMSGQRGREITNGAHYVPLEDIESYRSQTGVPILTTMPLRHINATVATNSLRPFFSSAAGPQAGSSVALGNVGNNSAMLLQGFGPQVYAAVQLLKLVDVPTEAANLQIRVQRLEYAAAEEIEPLLNDILNDRSRIRQQQVGQPGQGGVPTGDPSGTTVQLKIAVHQSLHAIILSGTTEQIQEAQELIAKLDIPAEPVDGKANVIRLKNVLADDLRKVLAQFVQQDAQA
ncbi:MAG TPA: secretin N-terminal domain-containing protein, partial [Planctomycetota bacterium]|nr:secretin N-terminal domain-containing protein [Planctomycetota bacterium]